MVLVGEVNTGTLKFLPKLFGTCDNLGWRIHLTCWIFGLFPLALRPLTNKIPITSFHFMDGIDLETKNGVNCVTRWADRANDDFTKMNQAGNRGPSEYKPKKKLDGDKPSGD